jgi:hypothetical protein
MITIPVSEVKKFISAAKPIKDSKMLPIYAFVKLVCEGSKAVFYKINGNSFVVCHVEADFKKDETLLIEEKTLFGFTQFSGGKEIIITKDGEKVTLDDGSRTISCKTFPVSHFSDIQEKSGEDSYTLTDEVLSSLFIAKAHIMPPADEAMRAPASFVHMAEVSKKFYVTAWNGHILYMKECKDSLPTLSLDPETISVIYRFQLCTYSRCGNYDYFDGGVICYGFIKPECKTPDISKIVSNLKQDVTFSMLRKPIVDFCEMVINVNGSSVPPEVSIEPSSKTIVLKFQDVSGDQNAEESVPVTGKIGLEKEFLFQPKNMLTVLKDLGCETIRLSYVQRNLIITSEEEKGYSGSIMGLARL